MGKLDDVKLLLSTDRRLWAAGGFICFALFFWLISSGGDRQQLRRGSDFAERAPRARLLAEPLIQIDPLMTKEIELSRKENRILRDDFQRAINDIAAQNKEMDEKIESLVDRLEAVTKQVEELNDSIVVP